MPDPFREYYYGQVLFHRFCLPKLDGVVGISTPFVELAQARGIPALLLPVPCPPEVERPAVSLASFPARGSGFTFFYTGVLQSRDMPEAMLEAMRSLVRQKAGIGLVVSGRNDIYREGEGLCSSSGG